MIAPLLWSLLAFPGPFTSTAPSLASSAFLQEPDDADVDAKIAAAGKDVAKLVALANGYMTAGQDAAAKRVYKKVLEVDADHEAAHKALGHQLYDKKWFGSFAELAKYKREESAKMKAKGLVRVKDEWVPEADAPFLIMGWAKDERGQWAHPSAIARAKQVADWQAAGYQFRADDNSWIAPADFEKWTALLWKCGDEWVDLAKANEYHAKIEHPWKLEGEHYTVWTTCDWEGGNVARWYADKAYPELVRLFGVEPARKPHFIVLSSLAQYNEVSGGNPPVLPESEGISSLHGAYFADLAFDPSFEPPLYIGAGVCFWDRKDEKLKGWGPYFVRWASAQSFLDAIDPSWTTVAERLGAVAGGGNLPPAAPFWNEKKIPRWLRYGAASYVERYAKDPEAAEGADPWALRQFAFGEIKKGGMHELGEVFAFAIDVNKADYSSRLYHEAGLVVAFLLDGAKGDKKLAAKLQAFQTALKSGSKPDVTVAVDALQKELLANEPNIRKFGGL
ncbi:MAG: hypothetical protein ACKVXR_10035 [Planctomycetota bacterium]